MDTRKDYVIGLLQEIEKQHKEQTEALKKQLFLTRIAALAGCVLTAGILVALLLLVPPLVGAVHQTQKTLTEVSGTLEEADNTMRDIQSLFEEEGLVGQSSRALQQTTDKISRMDIESLNSAIRDLGAVVEPLADFFGRFNK